MTLFIIREYSWINVHLFILEVPNISVLTNFRTHFCFTSYTQRSKGKHLAAFFSFVKIYNTISHCYFPPLAEVDSNAWIVNVKNVKWYSMGKTPSDRNLLCKIYFDIEFHRGINSIIPIHLNLEKQESFLATPNLYFFVGFNFNKRLIVKLNSERFLDRNLF